MYLGPHAGEQRHALGLRLTQLPPLGRRPQGTGREAGQGRGGWRGRGGRGPRVPAPLWRGAAGPHRGGPGAQGGRHRGGAPQAELGHPRGGGGCMRGEEGGRGEGVGPAAWQEGRLGGRARHAGGLQRVPGHVRRGEPVAVSAVFASASGRGLLSCPFAPVVTASSHCLIFCLFLCMLAPSQSQLLLSDSLVVYRCNTTQAAGKALPQRHRLRCINCEEFPHGHVAGVVPVVRIYDILH